MVAAFCSLDGFVSGVYIRGTALMGANRKFRLALCGCRAVLTG